MNVEEARLLAQALRTRWAAESGLIALLSHFDEQLEPPDAIMQSMVIMAETYVHEQRIINRIIHEARDE